MTGRHDREEPVRAFGPRVRSLVPRSVGVRYAGRQ